METKIPRLAAAFAVMALLLPGLLLISSTPTASAATPDIPNIGRVTASGTDILVDGVKPSQPFFGVVDSTALAFATDNYINGNHGVAGWSSVFNGPDTGNRMPVTPNDTPDAFWNQYFAQVKSLGFNMVRIGPHDIWGTGIAYNAWAYHHEQYMDLLNSMAYYAQCHGVWLDLSMGGSQEYPAFSFNGGGTVFDPGSQAFANYITYVKDIMVGMENWNSIALYDVFNEPDHNNVYHGYWISNGGKVAFNNWANAIADATAGVSTHPRNMGVAGFGDMFGMNQEDFNLATGNTRFEVLHRHYYGSNTDPTNFQLPEQWADAVGKPLFWGELGYNGVYPLTRYTFAEQAIWTAGGQAITSMVATGTPGYPYYSGVSGDAPVPRTIAKPSPPTVPNPAPVVDKNNTLGPSNEATNKGSPLVIKATEVSSHQYAFSFSGKLSGEKVTAVTWNFGDGNTSTETSPVHQFDMGNHLVTVKVTTESGKVLTSTYGVGPKSGQTTPASGNLSIAGAIGWGSADSILMIIGLACASIIGLFSFAYVTGGLDTSSISKLVESMLRIRLRP